MPKSFILFAGFLLILFLIRFFYFQSLPRYKTGESFSQDFTILSVPRTLFGSQILDLTMPNGEKVSLKTSLIPTLSYGDKVHAEGQITEKYFQGRKTLEVNNPIMKLENEKRNGILAVVFAIRQRIETFFNSNLDNISSGLMLGIVFGIKASFPASFATEIKNVGLLHIIAASGMNVTILIGFSLFTLGLFLKRQHALLITLALIAFYCVLSGFSASIIRAGIMGAVAITASVLGRQNKAVSSLFITALIMLDISPNLMWDVGFQLSFAATAGILFLKPILDSKIRLRAISSDLNTTLAAQAGTIPVMAKTFGTFSVISLPVNLLVLWTVPILMVIGAVAAVASFIFEPLGRIILYLCLPLILYLRFVIDVFGKFPALIDLSNLPFIFFIGYYLILLGVVSFKRK